MKDTFQTWNSQADNQHGAYQLVTTAALASGTFLRATCSATISDTGLREFSVQTNSQQADPPLAL